MKPELKPIERMRARSLTHFAVWVSILLSSHVAVAGGVGDGGGSVLSCPGVSHLELTDINEVRAREPHLTEKIAELRKKSEPEIIDHVAKNLLSFLTLTIAENKERSVQVRGLNQLKIWLKQIHDGVTFAQMKDPNDSGAVHKTLLDCVELRVAVNRGYDVYGSAINGEFGRLHMRVNKKRWNQMPLFDQYGLVVHELLYAFTEARVDLEQIDPLVKRKKTSERIRHLVGLILSGKASALTNPFDFLPWNAPGRLSCAAGSAEVHREDSQFDRIHFDLLPAGKGQVQVMLTTVYGVPVLNPNYAVTDLDLDLVTDTTRKFGENPYLVKSMNALKPFFPTRLAQLKVLDLGQSSLELRGTNSYIRFFFQERAAQAKQTGIESSVYLQFRQVDSSGNTQDFNGYVSCHSPAPPSSSKD